MFKKAIIALSIAAVSAASAVAQAQPVGDYKKVEFFAGYSNGQVDTGLGDGNVAIEGIRKRENFNGVNFSGVYNASRYVGLKGDVSTTFNNTEYNDTISSGGFDYQIHFKSKNSLTNFVGGIQLKDNNKSGVFKPFAHAMAGVAHARTKISEFGCITPVGGSCAPFDLDNESFTSTGFSSVIGGGIDFRVNDRFQVRAIQLDYNPTRLEGAWQHNYRIGAGIVF